MSFINAPMYDWLSIRKESKSALIRRWKNDPHFSQVLLRAAALRWENLTNVAEGMWTAEDIAVSDTMIALGEALANAL